MDSAKNENIQSWSSIVSKRAEQDQEDTPSEHTIDTNSLLCSPQSSPVADALCDELEDVEELELKALNVKDLELQIMELKVKEVGYLKKIDEQSKSFVAAFEATCKISDRTFEEIETKADYYKVKFEAVCEKLAFEQHNHIIAVETLQNVITNLEKAAKWNETVQKSIAMETSRSELRRKYMVRPVVPVENRFKGPGKLTDSQFWFDLTELFRQRNESGIPFVKPDEVVESEVL